MTDTRKYFDESLSLINALMIKLFEDTRRMFEMLFQSIEENNMNIAQKIIDYDPLINDLEKTIDREVFLIILKRCPVAGDLRKLMTATKIATDLERIADYAENIAGYLLKTKHDNQRYRNDLMAYKPLLLNMLKNITHAYEKDSLELAFSVSEEDDAIDTLYRQHMEKYIAVIKQSTESEAEEAGRAILVIKQFERAGDHITNIAEQIVYLESGKQVELN